MNKLIPKIFFKNSSKLFLISFFISKEMTSLNKLINLCHQYLEGEIINEDALIRIAQEMGAGFTVDDIIAYSKLEELKDYREAIDFIYNFEEPEDGELREEDGAIDCEED